MRIDILEVLTRALRISWTHKSLWLFGIVISLPVLLILPINILSIYLGYQLSTPAGSGEIETLVQSGTWITVWLGFIAFFLIVLTASIFTSTIGIIGPTLGTLYDEDDKEIKFSKIFKQSLPFFWRVLGLLALTWLAMMIIILFMQVLIMFVSIITFGIGMILMMPLMLLLYPLMILVYAYLELCLVAIVKEDARICEALQIAWMLFKVNFWSIVLISLLLFLIIWLATSILIVPFALIASMVPVIPLMLASLGIAIPQINLNTLLILSGLSVLLIIPLVCIYSGFSLAFWQSSWTLVYSHLTHHPNTATAPKKVDA